MVIPNVRSHTVHISPHHAYVVSTHMIYDAENDLHWHMVEASKVRHDENI